MARIFFCGDTHGNFEHVIAAVREHRPAAVVFLGDLQPQRPLEQALQPILDLTEIWWIHGNHDTDTQADHDHLFRSALADRSLHGRVFEIAGVRIAGLGGVFRGAVWYPPDIRHESYAAWDSADSSRTVLKAHRDERACKHRSSIFPVDYMALVGERAEILVTHEAPSCHPHGFDAIDELARSLGVSKTFHGHHHDCLDYSAHREQLGFAAFGVGFCGITDQEGLIVCAGDFDELRAYRQARGNREG